MVDDRTFHLIFLSLLLMLVGVRADFRSRLRKAGSDQRKRRNEILKELRNLGVTIAALLVVVDSFVPDVFGWSDVPMWSVVRWIAVVVSAIGIVWLLWSTRAAAARQARRRVTREWMPKGPYLLVRHPIRFGVLIELVSMPLLAANWVIALFAVIWIGHLVFVGLPREEAKRVQFLGEVYQQYSSKTPVLIPRWTRSSSLPLSANRPSA